MYPKKGLNIQQCFKAQGVYWSPVQDCKNWPSVCKRESAHSTEPVRCRENANTFRNCYSTLIVASFALSCSLQIFVVPRSRCFVLNWWCVSAANSSPAWPSKEKACLYLCQYIRIWTPFIPHVFNLFWQILPMGQCVWNRNIIKTQNCNEPEKVRPFDVECLSRTLKQVYVAHNMYPLKKNICTDLGVYVL